MTERFKIRGSCVGLYIVNDGLALRNHIKDTKNVSFTANRVYGIQHSFFYSSIYFIYT